MQDAGETAFLQNLRHILAKNAGSADVGRINVIGLDRLKERLGARWEQVNDRVHALARSALQRCLQPEDIWTTCGDKYVIAFGSLNPEVARTKCRMIAQIIESALLGEADGQSVAVATAVATVDGQVLLRDLPSLDAMLASAPEVMPGVPSDHPLTTSTAIAENVPLAAESITADASRQFSPREGPIWQAGDERMPSPQPTWIAQERRLPHQEIGWSFNQKPMIGAAVESVETSAGGSPSPGPWSELRYSSAVSPEGPIPWKTQGSLANTGPSFTTSEQAAPWAIRSGQRLGARAVEALELVQLEEDVEDEIMWEPIWDVRHERIPIYRAKYVRNSRVWIQTPSDELLVRADFAMRDRVLREVTGALLQSRYVLLGLPVQFWTISNYMQRRAYTNALAERISPASRKFLLIYITDVPAGVPASRMLELLASLRPFCREIVVEAPLQNTDFAALSSMRIFAVGGDLTGSKEPERIQMLQIDHFARGAAKAGIANCALAGVQSMPMVTAAIAAGFRYISGRSIGPFGPRISKVRPLSLDYVYRLNVEANGLRWPGSEQGAA